jgi:hypothetical protein
MGAAPPRVEGGMLSDAGGSLVRGQNRTQGPASLQNIELSVGPQALGPVWSLRPALGQMGFARSRPELDAEPALGRRACVPTGEDNLGFRC